MSEAADTKSPVAWLDDSRWENLSERDKSMIKGGNTEVYMKYRWAAEKYSATIDYARGAEQRFRTMLDKAYAEVSKAAADAGLPTPAKYH